MKTNKQLEEIIKRLKKNTNKFSNLPYDEAQIKKAGYDQAIRDFVAELDL